MSELHIWRIGSEIISRTDGMPSGLEFEEIPNLVKPLRFFSTPIVRHLTGDELEAFHAFCGANLEGFALIKIRHCRDATEVRMSGECGDQLATLASPA